MELDKLKEIWTSLDNRMQQQEVLKTTLIKEMLISKSDKALSRLINYSYFGLILMISMIPLMIWARQLPGIISNVFNLIVIAFLLFGIITGIIQLINLHKINFSTPLNRNIYLVQKTNLFNKRVSFIAYIIAAILFVCVIIAMLNSPYWIQLWRWFAIITAIFIGGIGGYWEYKRMYRRNFNSILKSLEELKELEETEE